MAQACQRCWWTGIESLHLAIAGKTPSSSSAYHVLLTAFPAMHASAYCLLRLLASVCRGALTPLHAGLTSLAAASLRRIASADVATFDRTLSSVRSEVRRALSTSSQILLAPVCLHHQLCNDANSLKALLQTSVLRA